MTVPKPSGSREPGLGAEALDNRRSELIAEGDPGEGAGEDADQGDADLDGRWKPSGFSARARAAAAPERRASTMVPETDPPRRDDRELRRERRAPVEAIRNVGGWKLAGARDRLGEEGPSQDHGRGAPLGRRGGPRPR